MIDDAIARTSEPMPFRLDADGVLRVGPTRLTPHFLINEYKLGRGGPDEIAARYSLKPEDVYFVLGHYYKYREEWETYLAEHDRIGEENMRMIEAEFPYAEFKAKLLARTKAAANTTPGN